MIRVFNVYDFVRFLQNNDSLKLSIYINKQEPDFPFFDMTKKMIIQINIESFVIRLSVD